MEPTPGGVEPIDLSLLELRGSDRYLRMPTCAVDLELLKRILRILRRAAERAAELEVSRSQIEQGSLLPAEQRTPPAVLLSQAKARNAVAITVVGASGEKFQAFDDERHLEPAELPHPLVLVTLDTGALYRRAGKTPPNGALVVFDFLKPPVLDLSNPSGQPTPNKSFLQVSGSDSNWVAGVYSELVDLLNQRRVPWGWLHSGRSYDALLFLLGLPAALSAGALVDRALVSATSYASGALRTAVLVYAFFAGLVLFRLLFSVVRWLYPHVEMRADPKPLALKWRSVLVVVLLGALGSLVATGLTHFF